MLERYAAVVALLAAKKHLCVLSCLFAIGFFFVADLDGCCSCLDAHCALCGGRGKACGAALKEVQVMVNNISHA